METLRSRIIDLLLDSEMSVSEICRALELNREGRGKYTPYCSLCPKF